MSSSKIQMSKQQTKGEATASSNPPMHTRKTSLSTYDNDSSSRPSSIPLRVALNDIQPSGSSNSSTYQSRHKSFIEQSSTLPFQPKVMPSFSMNSSSKRNSSTTVPRPTLRSSQEQQQQPGSPSNDKFRQSQSFYHANSNLPSSPTVSTHAHQNLNISTSGAPLIPVTQSALHPLPSPQDPKHKRKSNIRSSIQLGDIIARTTNTSSLTSIESPSALATASPKNRNARYSTGYFAKPTRVKGSSFSPEPCANLNDEIPPVPPLPEEIFMGKHSFHNTFNEQHKVNNRMSMHIPSATTTRHANSRKSIGIDLRHNSNSFKDGKYPEFAVNDYRGAPSAPTHSPVQPFSYHPNSYSNSDQFIQLPAFPNNLPIPPHFDGMPRKSMTQPNSPSEAFHPGHSISTAPIHKTLNTSKSTGSFHTSRFSKSSNTAEFFDNPPTTGVPQESTGFAEILSSTRIPLEMAVPTIPVSSRTQKTVSGKPADIIAPSANPSRSSTRSRKSSGASIIPFESPVVPAIPASNNSPLSPRTSRPRKSSIVSASSTDTSLPSTSFHSPRSRKNSDSSLPQTDSSPQTSTPRSRKNSSSSLVPTNTPAVPAIPRSLTSTSISNDSRSPKLPLTLQSPGLIKSQAMTDLTSQITNPTSSPSVSSLNFATQSSPRRSNFSSRTKSPYRPLNRPAHVYPQINKKPNTTEEDSPDKSFNLVKIRSKSTVAKQWTTLSTSLNSSSASAKRLLLSPFSSEYRRASQHEQNQNSSSLKQETTGRNPAHKTYSSTSPVEDKEEIPEEQKEIQNIMKGLVKTMPDEERIMKRYEEAKKLGLIKESMTPSLAAKAHRLNIYERGEILDYRNVYFCGRPDIKKISGDIRHAVNNYGFDDSNGDYHVVPGDHIAYRYEILGVLGKGSFGKVLKCIDHKSGKLVAVKLIINRKRFHMQALVEADILRVLSQWVRFFFFCFYLTFYEIISLTNF